MSERRAMGDQDHASLDPRSREVLKIIIEEHVRSGEPVSSRLTSRYHTEHLSPATIRNIMMELTERGYLEQPHTSAGRVPTDRGYRLIVDEVLSSAHRLPGRESRRIEDLVASSGELEAVLNRASRLLAELTRNVGVVLAPDLEQAVLEHVDFVRIRPFRVVAIFVSQAGTVIHRVVDTEEDIPQENLDRIAGRFREHFVGITLPEARRQMIELLRADEQGARQLGRRAIGSVMSILESPFPEESGELIVEGASRLLDVREFADVERLRAALRTLEERTQLLRILDRCMTGRGVQVIIGSEANDPGLSLMAIVASSFSAGAQGKGMVGVVGPRRMEYARAVAVVDRLARTISQILAGEQGMPGADET